MELRPSMNPAHRSGAGTGPFRGGDKSGNLRNMCTKFSWTQRRKAKCYHIQYHVLLLKQLVLQDEALKQTQEKVSLFSCLKIIFYDSALTI